MGKGFIPYLITGFIVLVVLTGGIGYLFFGSTEKTPSLDRPQEDRFVSGEKIELSDSFDDSIVYLYFADKGNTFLIAEERQIVHSKDPVEFGKIIIKALIDGPQKDLMRTVPKETRLRAFFITQEKTAYVDLSEAVRDNHPGGSQTELNTIYSIVNSLVLNIPQIEKVKVLIGGRESETLAGHIDLRFPFKANMLIVR